MASGIILMVTVTPRLSVALLLSSSLQQACTKGARARFRGVVTHHAGRLCGVLWHVKGHLHVALRRQVVHLVRLDGAAGSVQ